MNNNDEIPASRKTSVGEGAEEREGAGGDHEQKPVNQEASLGDRENEGIRRGHETKDGGSLVVLPLDGDKEVPGYTGGYTVKRHGVLSIEGGGSTSTTEAAGRRRNGEDVHTAVAVDAVQLEFGSRLRRTPEARSVVAKAVATAVFDYLQQAPRT